MASDDDELRELPTRRVATRYIVRMPVTLRVGTRSLEATIVDISDSGARLESPALNSVPGASVSIEMHFKLSERIRMLTKLVRETPGGCALRFVDPDPFLRVFVKLARLHDEAVGEDFEKLDPEF